jgi:hypothetical protein
MQMTADSRPGPSHLGHATSDRLRAARAALATPLRFEEVLAKLGGRDRGNAARRVTAMEDKAENDRSRLWQRLACSLMTLAPVAKFVGKDAVEFYVPDGRYKMQVFALEDVRDGNVTVYCPDVSAEAVAAGLLVQTGQPEPHALAAAGSGEPLWIEAVDAAAMSPGAHVKNLTNWKRRAVRIKLPPRPAPAQVEAVELLCAIALGEVVTAPAPAPTS